MWRVLKIFHLSPLMNQMKSGLERHHQPSPDMQTMLDDIARVADAQQHHVNGVVTHQLFLERWDISFLEGIANGSSKLPPYGSDANRQQLARVENIGKTVWESAYGGGDQSEFMLVNAARVALVTGKRQADAASERGA